VRKFLSFSHLSKLVEYKLHIILFEKDCYFYNFVLSHVSGTKKMEYKTRQWHEKCFCCVVCKNPIGTKSFIPREQEIYCAGCYEDKFATRCVKCNKVGHSFLWYQWHLVSYLFIACRVKNSLNVVNQKRDLVARL